jgi:hypothetical protein
MAKQLLLITLPIIFATTDIIETAPEPATGSIEEMLWSQVAYDRAHIGYVPLMVATRERIPEKVWVTLAEVLHSGHHSAVFSIVEHDDIVIKYEAECNPGLVHPLVYDFRFGLKASSLGISPRPIFLSPPARVPPTQTFKTPFGWTPQEGAKCFRDGGLIRFMILPKLGVCYNQVDRTTLSTRHVFQLGLIVLEHLSEMHRHKFFHGDIHAGNICRSRESGGDILLIDYGRADNTEEIIEGDREEAYRYVHPALSPWELQGHQPSPRDDIFKLLFTLVDLLVLDFDSSYSSFSGPRLFEWKSSGEFLDSIDYSKYPEQFKPKMREIFDMIISIDSPLGVIPYQELDIALRQIHEFV